MTGGYSLLITLVSSTSLAKVRLQNPLVDAADLCSSAGGAPVGSPTRILGIPGSVSGSCAFRPSSPVKGAAVAAFIRGNVAVLIEISSRSNSAVSPLTTEPAAHEQYAALPPGEFPSRAVVSMSSGSSSGSASWPLSLSGSSGAPADEGAGEDRSSP